MTFRQLLQGLRSRKGLTSPRFRAGLWLGGFGLGWSLLAQACDPSCDTLHNCPGPTINGGGMAGAGGEAPPETGGGAAAGGNDGAGSSTSSGGDTGGSGAGDGGAPSPSDLCRKNEHVMAGECKRCPAGSVRAAGDDPAGPDTQCDLVLCEADQRVAEHSCLMCPPGTTNAAGDDASGSDTSCDAMLCSENEHVVEHTCAPCSEGTTRASGDDATGADTSCQGVLQVVAGEGHTCVLLVDGTVKCWGYNADGQLGLGDTDDRGDDPDEMGSALPAVQLGAGQRARALAAGGSHTCALLDEGAVKCWGGNSGGQLGLGDTEHRGDEPDEMGSELPAVELGSGRSAKALGAGFGHTCALLDDGTVKCWGFNSIGQLGLGDTDDRGSGPGEMGSQLPAVALGSGQNAAALAAGDLHTCALLDDGAIKCWGYNSSGRLGVGDTQPRGDGPDEMGAQLPAVALGAGRNAVALEVGYSHSCALLDDGTVKCWGGNSSGQLGLGDIEPRGDGPDEMGSQLPAVALGTDSKPVSLEAGYSRTCALFDNGTVKCWGENFSGQLGLGDTQPRGDGPDEMGSQLPAVALGAGSSAVALAAGGSHTCALLDDGAVKCWGFNSSGQLGQGDTDTRGDEPGEMGDELPLVQLW